MISFAVLSQLMGLMESIRIRVGIFSRSSPDSNCVFPGKNILGY